MKFGQMLVQLVANTFNLFLALLWRLETNSRTFNYFDKFVTQKNLFTLVDHVYYFFTKSMHTFKRVKDPELILVGFLLNAVVWLIKKNLDSWSSSSRSCKIFPKNVTFIYMYYLIAKYFQFQSQIIYNSKDIFKNVLYNLC